MDTSSYLILNGRIIAPHQFLMDATNRAFRYGDGVFESIRVVNGQPMFVEHHWQRAAAALGKLGIEHNGEVNAASLESNIYNLLQKNNITRGGRVRITFWRDGGGFYLPENNGLAFLIEAVPFPHNEYTLCREGLFVDQYPEMHKQLGPLSAYKLINAQLSIMASIYARKNNLGDVLLVNEKHNITESSRSNIFIVSNGVLYTPAISEGCVGGIMRMQVINMAIENNIKVYECPLTPQHLLAADEMFLTNAVQGLEWVASYRMKRYFHRMSDRIVEMLNSLVPVN